MTDDDPAAEMPVFWGHGIIDLTCAHARETRGGRPVADTTDDGAVMGYAICGCLLIDDVTADEVASGAYRQCSRCLELLANRQPGVDYPLWTPDD